ncbi:putative Chemotaxis protein CheY [Gammaproteobacteria bacterium]
MRILIGEDSRTQSMYLAKQLKKLFLNPEIEFVRNGEDVCSLLYLHEGRFQLAFLDIHMPLLNGVDALRRLRKNSTVLPPIIMTTADSHRELVIECASLGVRGYLIKPYEINELREKIRAALLAERQNSPVAT